MDWQNVLLWILAAVGVAWTVALVAGLWLIWRVRRRRRKLAEQVLQNGPQSAATPPEAEQDPGSGAGVLEDLEDVWATLRRVPLPVVLLMDVLDLGLDFLSAPLAWVILGRMGLEKLRPLTVVQALVPGTQFVPTMTLAWIAARIWPGALPGEDRPRKQVTSRSTRKD